ncbi:MAG: AAA domain-containing protein [Marinomonas sp.]
MEFIQKLTRYLRSSLLDTERLSPDIKALADAVKQPKFSKVLKQAPFAIPDSVWLLGQVSTDTTEDIFHALQVKQQIQETTVVLIPRVDLKTISNTAFVGSGSPVIVPLVLEVLITREGRLKPTQSTPYVPREWLAPNEKDEGAFAKAEVLDAFLTLNPFNAQSWEELLNYCQRLMLCLVSDDPRKKVISDKGTIWDIPLIDGYETNSNLSLMLLEPKIIASFHIRKIYDAIVKGCQPSRLFINLFNKKTAPVEDYEDLTDSLDSAQYHVAQMTGEFPLARKQRNALHHVERMKEGSILTVNGPPGTGKTTLLRSVVANAWVSAAYHKTEPPITFVSSSNNQAVTNVLDSFYSIDEDGIEEALKGRWLPVINTYGLKGVGSKADLNYPYMKKDGSGIMQQMEQMPTKELSDFFESSFNRWIKVDRRLTLDQMISYLHQSLANNIEQQQSLPRYLSSYSELKKTLIERFGSCEFLDSRLVELQNEEADLDGHILELDCLLRSFLQSWKQRSFWSSIFSFLPFIKNRWMIANELLAFDNNLTLEGNYNDENIREEINRKKLRFSESKHLTTLAINELTGFRDNFYEKRKQLDKALASVSYKDDVDSLTQALLSEFLDTNLRFKAFKLATHYWEGCWLKGLIDAPPAPAKTKDDRLKQYRRYAKLAPCFVATFYTLPSFMEISRKEGDSWFSDLITDGIDLLIVDEAGQALPHVAGASFAVAKKALLVGDVYQIEPVWTLPKGIDIANLRRCHLLEEDEDYVSFWLNSHMTAGSGNLMRLAHRQATQIQYKDLEPGLYLTEHRRCYDDIIEYCNQLIYKGHLEAKRGRSPQSQSLPSMGFFHHQSQSIKQGSSRINTREADVIVRWVSEYIESVHADKRTEEGIAIITPFRRQAVVIMSVLKKAHLKHIKVGTVNTFQGAESDIVLFSSVYGENDGIGNKFYDRGPNMLNVAVSRAKNTFIIFGDNSVFGLGGKSSPSALLRQNLQKING